MRGNRLLQLLCVIWFIPSCAGNQENDSNLDAYSQQAGEYLLSLERMDTDEAIDTSNTELLEFKLNIQRKDGADLIAFDGVKELIQSRIYYYSYRIGEAISLQQNNKRWSVDFCHFERSFDLKKGRNFMLAFDQKNIDQSKPFQIVIDSDVLETGPVKFKIASKN